MNETLVTLSTIYRNQAKIEEAENLLSEALQTANDKTKGSILGVWSSLHFDRGNLKDAAEALDRAANLLTRSGKVVVGSIWKSNAAMLKGKIGKHEDAIADLLTCSHAQKSLGSQFEYCSSLCHLGQIYLAIDEDKKAEDVFQRSLKVSTASNYEQRNAIAICGLARVAEHQGDIEKAIQLTHQSLEILRSQEPRKPIAFVLPQLIEHAIAAGEIELAGSTLNEAETMIRHYNPLRLIEFQIAKASYLLVIGRVQIAEEILGNAEAGCRHLDLLPNALLSRKCLTVRKKLRQSRTSIPV